MTENTPEQLRFQEALRADGYSLSNFATGSPSNLFPTLIGEQPQFFKNNLQSANRILKVFENDPHSNIRIFYLQLLRVTFQTQTENGFNTSFMYNLIHVVFHNEFEILFTPQTEPQRDLYCDFQFKKLFAEFITMIQNEESPNVEDIVNAYPIMDVVFIHIFRSMLASQGVDYNFQQKIPTNVVFSELCSLLGLNIVSFNNNCWKFEDSDMFCYEHTQNQQYLAYTRNEGGSAEDFNSGEAQQYQGYQNPLDQYQNQYQSPLDQYKSPLDQYQSYPSSNYDLNSYGLSQQNNYSSSYQAPSYTSNSYDATPSYNPSRSNAFQSLSDMADRHVNVEAKHDYVDNSLRVPASGNEVKESMISVTYEFVDFTGQSTAYKDRVPRRLANASGLTQSKSGAEAETSKPSFGLDQYMNKPIDSLGSYGVNNSSYLDTKKQDIYKPSNIESYMNPASISTYIPKSDFQTDDFNSLYKSAAVPSSNYNSFDSYKPEIYGSQATQALKPTTGLDTYTPAYTTNYDSYKPSTALDSLSYGSTYKPAYEPLGLPSTSYDPKPLVPSYDAKPLYSPPERLKYEPFQTEPVVVKRQQQKFTGLVDLDPLASSNFLQAKYSSQTSFSGPVTSLGGDDLGDYYNDFTSDQLLNMLAEPYKSKVQQIKSRVRGWKRIGTKSGFKPLSANYGLIGYP